jgi:hypothetical protein
VKRFAVFFLILSYILGSTPLSQVFRLPSLLEHYSQHKAVAQDLDVPGFLYLHYVTDDQDPDDDEQEKKLPFKSETETPIVSAVPSESGTASEIFVTEALAHPLLHCDSKPLSAYRAIILQPPKLG